MCALMRVLYQFLISALAISASSPRLGLFDQHQHALVNVLEGLGDTHLPVTLIHLDSHADMSVAKFFEASLQWDHLRQNPEAALSLSQHNSWVAASWLLGVVNKLIFVEPPWSTEFGTHTPHRSFFYSAGTINGEFKVSIRTADGVPVTFEYWHTIDDGELHPERHMGNIKDMTDRVDLEVEIIPFEELLTTLPSMIAKEQSAIWLDIDMSVFATESPSHMQFFQETRIPIRWQQLIADAWKDVSIITDQTKSFGSVWWSNHLSDWQEQCPNLKEIFENKKNEDDMHDIITAPPEGIPSASFDPSTAHAMESSLATKLYDKTMLHPEKNPTLTRTEVIRLLAVFESDLEKLLSTHEEGEAVHMLWHAIVSPIHLSSNKEIDVMMSALGCLLRQLTALSKTPAFVTLARSESTPRHLVRHIECSALSVLSEAYPTRDIYFNSGFDADQSLCNLGYSFRSIGEADSPEEESHLSHPVELVIANISPEPLIAHWKSPSGELSNSFPVPAFSYDNNNCVSFDGHIWVLTTPDGVVVDEKTVSATDGHTQVWTVTTGQVDAVLRQKGLMRHRAL
jgi:hypothetical protein